MANNIIETSDPGIVVKEIPIKLSDEKFKNALSRTYERAQKDTEKPNFKKAYSVFLSIAGTLFLSLLTSKFQKIGQVSANAVTCIVWIACVFCAVLGFILMGLRVSEKVHSDTGVRDSAVDEIFNECVNK